MTDELFDMFILYAFGVQIQNCTSEWDYTFHFKGGLDNFELIRDLYGKNEEYESYIGKHNTKLIALSDYVIAWKNNCYISPIKIRITVEE